ncbi:hypothetical protein F66182_4619 [Fusarium sp. NRRL 66182]|nr:hypothetical protein F66182_4619 [Fusarium sp. NRRL 66182]
MLLPAFVGTVGLLCAAVEAAPRGSWLGNAQQERIVARSDPSKNDVYRQPSYTPINNSTTSAPNSATLDPSIQCPTDYVKISTKTVDVTVTVTTSSNGSYYTTEICHDCTKTLTISNTVFVPPSKYASTLSHGEHNTGSPYHPVNSTYVTPHQTKAAYDPSETGGAGEHPYMNSTLGHSFSTPIDKYASHTGYQKPDQSGAYSTSGGYSSPPVHTKPVYSGPAHANSTATRSGYAQPVYTKPVYSGPVSGNATSPVYTKPINSTPVYSKPAGYNSSIVAPSYTKPMDTPIYSAPVYTKHVIPDNSSTINPPVYTKPIDTPIYTPPVYTKPAVPGNSSAVIPPAYTKPVDTAIYTPPAHTRPVVPDNSSAIAPPVYTRPVDTPVYTPPVYTRPGHSQPVVPGNSSVVDPPEYTRPSKTPIYTPPVYTKPVIPGNSSAIDPPAYTKPVDTPVYSVPVYTKPVYPEPVIPGNSSAIDRPAYTPPVDTAIYTPPVYTKPVYSRSVVPGNSSTAESSVSSTIDYPLYTPPVYHTPVFSSGAASSIPTSSVGNPIYTPPVYYPPFVTSESSGLPTTSATSQHDGASLSATESTSSSSSEVGTSSTETTTGTPNVSTTREVDDIENDNTTVQTTPGEETTLAETMTETPTTAPAADPYKKRLVIDVALIPASTAHFKAGVTAAVKAEPTKTVYEHNAQDGATSKDTAYCGVKGEASEENFLAEYTEQRRGEAITLEGCYQFCDNNTRFAYGCQAYRFYSDGNGAPRCVLYGKAASEDIIKLDSTVEGRWYDISCGSPTDDTPANYEQPRRGGLAAAINLDLGF